jgi:predicted CXXCH cytochrome family protein
MASLTIRCSTLPSAFMLGFLFLFLNACGGAGEQKAGAEPGVADFVGREQCRNCHEREVDAWEGSDHDRAMQEATEATVLGDFSNVRFSSHGITSTFSKRDGKYLVTTDGPDGRMHEYEVRYTFGVTPLQQYLVEFPGGRFQVLPLCWDTRPRAQGGQRWFHIYPNEVIDAQDELHWTGLLQNWNFMCAECHSTNLLKNYEAAQDSFATSWAEIDVSCEACHGPGSAHVAWAEEAARGGKSGEGSRKGLQVILGDPSKGTWVFDKGASVARRTVPRGSSLQVETCARCHSRRSQIWAQYKYGTPLMDTHLPEALLDRMYFADGQIRDEVYVYGSFLQSKMYQAGVVCSDCHEPHSAKVYVQGNALCYRCHLYETYAGPKHHFHKPDSTGALCVECHAPERTYMVVDPRRDHSFRIPRPDFTVRYGIPNACTKCHPKKSPQWAADSVRSWYGPRTLEQPHYGEILSAGREIHPGAEPLLAGLAMDRTKPGIVRSTALTLLVPYGGTLTRQAVRQAVYERDTYVRIGALSALEALGLEDRYTIGRHLLRDPLRAVRLEAVRAFASVPPTLFGADDRRVFDEAMAEYIESLRFNADRPVSSLALASFYMSRRMFDDAEGLLLQVIEKYPRYVYAFANLADLYRVTNRENEGEALLRRAVAIDPRVAELHYALGLLLVRQQRSEEALDALKSAAETDPEQATYAYGYALALNSVGQSGRAVQVLELALQRHPHHRDLLIALTTVNRDRGATGKAREFARRLVDLAPQDRSYQQLLLSLQDTK